MRVYVDTSALIALLDRDDGKHYAASRVFVEGLKGGVAFVTSNYVVSEACAVAQRRIGMKGVHALVDRYLPAMAIQLVDERTHAAALRSLLGANRRALSLVDCVGFEVMRDRGITACFAFDRHFAEQGFEVLPAL